MMRMNAADFLRSSLPPTLEGLLKRFDWHQLQSGDESEHDIFFDVSGHQTLCRIERNDSTLEVLDLAASSDHGDVIVESGSQACDSSLGPKIAEEFAKALKQNVFVTQLDLKGQRIGDEGAHRLSCEAFEARQHCASVSDDELLAEHQCMLL